VPLTEKVTFTTPFQSGNKVQIPKLIRWRFKMENNQALKVGVNFSELHTGWKFFYAKMHKDGRIRVPKLTLQLISGERTCLTGLAVEVMLEPA
jgi:hypothetical protein